MNNRERPADSRLFIGNLASEKTTKQELHDIFKQYGEIIEDIVIKKSFGFVQFDNPESAKAAMKGEQGRLVGDMKLDLNIADNREPRRRKRSRSRSRTRSRSRSRSRSPRRRSRSPRNRRRRSSRSRSRDRSRSRSPYRNNNNYYNNNNNNNFRNNRRRSNSQERKDNSRVLKVIHLGEHQYDYAQSIADIAKYKFGFGATTYYLDKQMISEAIHIADKEGYRYVIVVGRENLKNQTCRFNVMGKKRREEGVSEISVNDVAATLAKFENIQVPHNNPYAPPQQQQQQYNLQQYPSQMQSQQHQQYNPQQQTQQQQQQFNPQQLLNTPNILSNPLVSNIVSMLLSQNPSMLGSLLSSQPPLQQPNTYPSPSPTPSPTVNPSPLISSNTVPNPNNLFSTLQNLQNLPTLQNPSPFFVPQLQDHLNNNNAPTNNLKQNEELLRGSLQKFYTNPPSTLLPPSGNDLESTLYNLQQQQQQQQTSIPSQIQSIMSNLNQSNLGGGQLPQQYSNHHQQNHPQNHQNNDNNY